MQKMIKSKATPLGGHETKPTTHRVAEEPQNIHGAEGTQDTSGTFSVSQGAPHYLPLPQLLGILSRSRQNSE